jgi:hypothetical protein
MEKISMEATTRKILLAGALFLTLIFTTVYFSHATRPAAIATLAHVEPSKQDAGRQARTDGLQWLGTPPNSPPGKQETSRTSGDEVTELLASRKPADALTAYGIIDGCESLRPVFAIDPTPAELLPRKKQCASITDAMRRSRYDYLRVAAYAETPGAGSAWLRYGPGGDVTHSERGQTTQRSPNGSSGPLP